MPPAKIDAVNGIRPMFSLSIPVSHGGALALQLDLGQRLFVLGPNGSLRRSAARLPRCTPPSTSTISPTQGARKSAM